MEKCAYCGAEIYDNLTYCPNCGGPVSNSAINPVPQRIAKEFVVQNNYGSNDIRQSSSNNKIIIVLLAIVAIISITALFISLDDNAETKVRGASPVVSNNVAQESNATLGNVKADSYYAPMEAATAHSELNYKGVTAINYGDLSLLDGSFTSSKLYESQCKLVTRLYNKGIKEEFLTGRFEFVKFDQNDNIVANVYEKHRIIRANGTRYYTDCFYRRKTMGSKPYSIMTSTEGINPFTVIADGYITSTADLYVLPDTDALIFERVRNGDYVKVCEYPESHSGNVTYELSPKITDAESQCVAELNVDQDGWLFIKHPKYGYAWIRSGYVSY